MRRLQQHENGPGLNRSGYAQSYGISITNNGPFASAGLITVADNVPNSLAISGVVAGPGWNCNTVAQLVTCTSTTPVANGASSVVATINWQATVCGGARTKAATVTHAGDPQRRQQHLELRCHAAQQLSDGGE